MITIILSGPQGSGKSTIARAIEPVLRSLKIDYKIIETNVKVEVEGTEVR